MITSHDFHLPKNAEVKWLQRVFSDAGREVLTLSVGIECRINIYGSQEQIETLTDGLNNVKIREVL